jgi:hypothetical protein
MSTQRDVLKDPGIKEGALKLAQIHKLILRIPRQEDLLVPPDHSQPLNNFLYAYRGYRSVILEIDDRFLWPIYPKNSN